jgi:hypothetical protein
MNTYQFKGTRVYTEYITVELECETLEDAQKIMDSGDFDDHIISSSGNEEVEMEYIGIPNVMELDDPRLIDEL